MEYRTIPVMPYFFSIVNQLVDRTVFLYGITVYENIPVVVLICRIIAEETVVCITSAKNICGIICNKVFIVHSGNGFPRNKGVSFIIYFDGYIFMAGKSVKVRIPFHLNPAVNSVHKKINLYATVSGRHKGANHYLARFICTEIKGRHGDVCFCIFNHINPFKKGI